MHRQAFVQGGDSARAHIKYSQQFQECSEKPHVTQLKSQNWTHGVVGKAEGACSHFSWVVFVLVMSRALSFPSSRCLSKGTHVPFDWVPGTNDPEQSHRHWWPACPHQDFDVLLNYWAFCCSETARPAEFRGLDCELKFFGGDFDTCHFIAAQISMLLFIRFNISKPALSAYQMEVIIKVYAQILMCVFFVRKRGDRGSFCLLIVRLLINNAILYLFHVLLPGFFVILRK